MEACPRFGYPSKYGTSGAPKVGELMQNPIKISQKAILLHTLGIQVITPLINALNSKPFGPKASDKDLPQKPGLGFRVLGLGLRV